MTLLRETSKPKDYSNSARRASEERKMKKKENINALKRKTENPKPNQPLITLKQLRLIDNLRICAIYFDSLSMCNVCVC